MRQVVFLQVRSTLQSVVCYYKIYNSDKHIVHLALSAKPLFTSFLLIVVDEQVH